MVVICLIPALSLCLQEDFSLEKESITEQWEIRSPEGNNRVRELRTRGGRTVASVHGTFNLVMQRLVQRVQLMAGDAFYHSPGNPSGMKSIMMTQEWNFAVFSVRRMSC